MSVSSCLTYDPEFLIKCYDLPHSLVVKQSVPYGYLYGLNLGPNDLENTLGTCVCVPNPNKMRKIKEGTAA